MSQWTPQKYKEFIEATIRNYRRGQWHPTCLENPMDGGAWQAAVHGVPKSRTRLSDFTFTFHFHALAKEMATHSSVLAWRIPDRGAWWAAIYGVARSRTRLNRLSSSSSSNVRNYTPIKWTTQEKRSNSYKGTTFKTESGRNRKYEQTHQNCLN